jgi:hypothetical protein
MKQAFPELQGLKRRLEHQVDILRTQLEEAQKQLDSVMTTAELLTREENQNSAFMKALNAVMPNDLRGLTQLDALVKIAKANNNRVRLTIAKDLLLKAGVTKSRKNATNIIFNVIKRSECFKRSAPGEYELLPDASPLEKEPALQ